MAKVGQIILWKIWPRDASAFWQGPPRTTYVGFCLVIRILAAAHSKQPSEQRRDVQTERSKKSDACAG